MELEGVAEIIKQFAEYLTQLISYLKSVFESFTKKDDAAEE